MPCPVLRDRLNGLLVSLFEIRVPSGTTNPVPRRSLFVAALAALVLFFLLGSRSLNEPDEGRYAEIALEMVESGDWLIPRIWTVPHMDKPPMTYWAIALSIQALGANEWAVRLPVALAGLSAMAAAWAFGAAMKRGATAEWSVAILMSSALFFVMARMVTTDMILTQFISWAVYFFWRAWQCSAGIRLEDEEQRAQASRRSFYWNAAAWAAMAGGFLTKGPIALAIPLVSLAALMFHRRDESHRRPLMLLGAIMGFALFCTLALPWYILAAQRLPGTLEFMVGRQAIGHLVGATSTHRARPLYYFLGVLAAGFLPWTLMLGWVWRKAHWVKLEPERRELWLLLSVWAWFTVGFFSLSRSKLPAYILPAFPPLAVLMAAKFEEWTATDARNAPPRWVFGAMAAVPALMFAAVPVIFHEAYRLRDNSWMWFHAAAAVIALTLAAFRAPRWTPDQVRRWMCGAAVFQLLLLVAYVPRIETALKSNQTLGSIGGELRRTIRAGDSVICREELPQGLLFYARPALSASNLPWLAGMGGARMPLIFPGNAKLLAPRLLADSQSVVQLMNGHGRVFVVGPLGTREWIQGLMPGRPLRTVLRESRWELLVRD
jgi:4-amino-4-deoxy-L-arabinose transferase-like glycosyltransferase